ncbi:MAG: glutamine-hydrolyzing carbamoyl-phosphate synthase small subunit [Chloroflexi bacterium]|nr:glutamine-hydrolyzing carbamoyl-phosphate synthase small subunit [Chloroflexota bacterium]
MLKNKGLLALEDGSTYAGESVAAAGEWVGEIVFNTSMMGYQEIITDPSYWGQMVVFTYPHIGNVGVNEQDVESRQPYVRAVIARQICKQPSNWRATSSLPAYLCQAGVPALSGIDTRSLTLRLRTKGVMRAAISTVRFEPERLIEMARNAPDMSALEPADEVTSAIVNRWTEAIPEAWQPVVRTSCKAPLVVVLDCGTKRNIMRCLVTFGAQVTTVPASTSAERILALKPDGVLVSNGPGDPTSWLPTVETIRQLIGRVPLFGLCLGHQLIALACGARTYKLPFGHHGSNHPIQPVGGGLVEITAQNHNYVVSGDSIANSPLEVTYRNLNDGTIEGLRSAALHITTVQHHPEASPGPHDSRHLLAEFVNSLGEA